MIALLSKLFAFDSVVNTGTKIIDKIAGTDWTSKEKAEWLLKYQEATRHQSLARRFIALSVTVIWCLLVTVMIVSYIIGNIFSIPEVLMIAKDMKMVMKDLVVEPMNLVIGFYFAINIIQGFKK
ncbi:TMhelix containing protein [Vibrio phage MZH0603]|nr:TMhelix containing protein [Vibrio phage MZH0603]